VGPPVILMALSAKYGIWVEPAIQPEPVPEAKDYYQPYPPAPAPPKDRPSAPPIPQAPPTPCYWSADGRKPVCAIPGREPEPEPVRTPIDIAYDPRRASPTPPPTCTSTPEPEKQIWRAISINPNRVAFNWRPSRYDTDGLSGTRGGLPPYHLNPAPWFQTTFGRPPGPDDRVVATTEKALVTAGFSVMNTPQSSDPHHVSIGGLTPGIVIREGQPSWPGGKSERQQIETILQSLFRLQIWP
jgi:hypothetical protein